MPTTLRSVGLLDVLSSTPYSYSAALLLQNNTQPCREHSGGERGVKGTHRPATNKYAKPPDGFPQTFERNDALWSDNEHSDVVRFQDSTIRVSQDQSQRARTKRRGA